MKLVHLTILLLNGAAAHDRHDVKASIDTLQAAGIVGIDGLCHRTDEALPVPKCTHPTNVVLGQSGLRGLQSSRKLSKDSEENSTEFYVFNICGTVIRYVHALLIAYQF